jgi:hypothetical protein
MGYAAPETIGSVATALVVQYFSRWAKPKKSFPENFRKTPEK